MSTEAPDLRALVAEWLKHQPASPYLLLHDKIACRCCGIVWVRIHADRVSWVLSPKKDQQGVVSTTFMKKETLAADKVIFDQITKVFAEAQHDSR